MELLPLVIMSLIENNMYKYGNSETILKIARSQVFHYDEGKSNRQKENVIDEIACIRMYIV